MFTFTTTKDALVDAGNFNELFKASLTSKPTLSEKKEGMYQSLHSTSEFIRFLNSIGSAENHVLRENEAKRLVSEGVYTDAKIALVMADSVKAIRKTRANGRTASQVLRRLNGYKAKGIAPLECNDERQKTLTRLFKNAVGFDGIITLDMLKIAIEDVTKVLCEAENSTVSIDDLGFGVPAALTAKEEIAKSQKATV